MTDRRQDDRGSIPKDLYILNGTVAYPGFYAPWLILSAFVMARDCSVGMATGYGLDDRGIGTRFLEEARDFALLHNVQTDSGCHRRATGVKLTTRLHLVPRSEIVELYLHASTYLLGA